MIKDQDLEKILLRSKELENSMSVSSGNNEEFVKISKEYSDLKPIVDNINAYNSNKKEYEELQLLLQEDDDEIVEIAKKEINLCKEKLIESESILKISLVPKDPLDEKNVIVEIRAGTGCLLYTSPSPRDSWASRMPSSAWKKKKKKHKKKKKKTKKKKKKTKTKQQTEA